MCANPRAPPPLNTRPTVGLFAAARGCPEVLMNGALVRTHTNERQRILHFINVKLLLANLRATIIIHSLAQRHSKSRPGTFQLPSPSKPDSAVHGLVWST